MKEHIIDCVGTATTKRKWHVRLWLLLTAGWPRKLPQTLDEWNSLKERLHLYFGVEDEPTRWYTVAGYVMSTPPGSMRRSLSYLANVANRLHVNQLAQDQRELATIEGKRRLEEAAKKVVEDESFKEGLNGDHRAIKPEWSDVPSGPHQS